MQHPLLLAPVERHPRTSFHDAFVSVAYTHKASWITFECLPLCQAPQGGLDHLPVTSRHCSAKPRTRSRAAPLRARTH
ncbi:hypothetical protein [Pseudomonas vranovensis]|uniref:hypothetical protein n=1 Tax=Pseudomonas vranovensis TaxID=321661 RepID=UPI0012EB9D94|nr:hypothetical protein [Pseudomonas vranovensis]